jgi:hypothetical protein
MGSNVATQSSGKRNLKRHKPEQADLMDRKQYDVFLAHNSADKPAVEELARVLRDQRRLNVWFDAWRLRPGLSWQKEMEDGIRGSNAGAVLVGKDGIGPWENEEMEALLQLAVREQLPVIPVLLPGAAAKPELPVFLANRHYVDLRKGLSKGGIDQLVWGITGENPHDRSTPTTNCSDRVTEPTSFVTSIEFTLPCPIEEFNENKFISALKSATGIDASKVRIASIRSQSTIAKIEGDGGTLDMIIAKLQESVDALASLHETTCVSRISWKRGSTDFEIEVASHLVAEGSGSAHESSSTARVDISRIVKYAPERLIGRETETGLLEDSWRKVVAGQVGRPRVLGFVALGGEGKTSLVAKWLAGMAGKDWPGCESVFAWSFYSQGSREQVAVSSDLFLVEALKFFGDPEMAGSARGAYEKGQRLAELVGAQRSLLILDGVEPLQYPPSSPTGSRLKDQGTEALLKGLAASSNGLCIVTSRYSIPDLAAFAESTWYEEELKRLSREAGVALLKDCGVKGSEFRPEQNPGNPNPLNEYEQLVEDVKGHALTLQILGQYLMRAHHGDIRRRDRVELAKADSKVIASHGFGTGHAFRAIAAYEEWLADDSEESRRELAVLRLLGLFDRPATADCVQALRKPPAIDGLTDPLVGLPDEDWEFTLTMLSDARLVSVNRDEVTGELVSLDAHPLVREHSATQLRDQHLDAWRAAHSVLYEMFRKNAKERPLTLEDLMPYYRAVAHGCQAGRHNEVLNEVYNAKIQQGQVGFAQKILGAAGEDLAALSWFFEKPWTEVDSTIDVVWQAWLPGNAGSRLRALTRIQEALEPTHQSLIKARECADILLAVIRERQYSELLIISGDITRAIEQATRAVDAADHAVSQNPGKELCSQPIVARAVLAAALHARGEYTTALNVFQDSERRQAGLFPKHPLLYSLWGFRYCDLLIEQRVPSEDVLERVNRTRELAREDLPERLGLLDGALDLLTVAKCHVSQFDAGQDINLGKISAIAGDALAKLRESGKHDFLPLGILVRVEVLMRQMEVAASHDKAAASRYQIQIKEDLGDARLIAERGPMPLYLADVLLHRARLFNDQKALAEARRLIEKHGYGRRLEELEDAEGVLLLEK